MISISLCMIVKNEEDVIARCLTSIKDIVDEIIIVDTGSTDNTKEIIKSYTDKIFDFKWIDDFSAARNFAFSKATKDYILWLDADDIILEQDRLRFKQLKQTLEEIVDIVMMKYNVGFDKNGNITLSYFRERLSKRTLNLKWAEPIHEYLQIEGTIINSDVCITHKKEHPTIKDRNLAIYKNMVNKGEPLSPRGLFYYARELYYNEKYDEAIEYFNKFLDTEKGWVEDNISACFDLSICYNIKNDKNSMLRTLLKSFEYDTPRAEICCQLGNYYFEKTGFSKAIFWYKIASELKEPTESWGFISHDYWGYIPCIQLCVCYDKVGDRENAIQYNEKAAKYKPQDPAITYNRNYFHNG
jgi:glycosyltransferase involved in cell wall biosynthesis